MPVGYTLRYINGEGNVVDNLDIDIFNEIITISDYRINFCSYLASLFFNRKCYV